VKTGVREPIVLPEKVLGSLIGSGAPTGIPKASAIVGHTPSQTNTSPLVTFSSSTATVWILEIDYADLCAAGPMSSTELTLAVAVARGQEPLKRSSKRASAHVSYVRENQQIMMSKTSRLTISALWLVYIL
jgi:hypothetical protein